MTVVLLYLQSWWWRSPSDQGVGHGKDLMIKGGRSDNNNGRNGGRVFMMVEVVLIVEVLVILSVM